MSLRSPLGKVLGHGSAKSGTGHWWAQRMTAIALVPLTLWFAFSILNLEDISNYQILLAWMSQPLNGILLILLVMTVVYHSSLGLQVVIVDSVHGAAGIAMLIFVRFASVALFVSGVYAVVKVSFGGGQ